MNTLGTGEGENVEQDHGARFEPAGGGEGLEYVCATSHSHLQVRKRRHSQVQQLVRSHTASKAESRYFKSKRTIYRYMCMYLY